MLFLTSSRTAGVSCSSPACAFCSVTISDLLGLLHPI
jgi:hypothetical protein